MKNKEAYLICGLKFRYHPKHESHLSKHAIGRLTALMRTMLVPFD